MPRETVRSMTDKFDLDISWDADPSRDNQVQIGMATRDHAATLAEALTPVSAYLGEINDVSPAQAAAHLAEYRGIYGQFDRAGLNRTIRLLRRVRDHVFGRDE